MFDWATMEWQKPAAQMTAPPAPRASAYRIQARYDNAHTTDENRRNFWTADYLSAKSANNFHVRRTLRARSRNEVGNGPYLFGITNDNADHLIDTGPTLQVLGGNAANNLALQQAFGEWWAEIDGVEKLRTCKLAKTVDGEGFLILKTVSDLYNSVKLYPVDVEADQVTSVMPRSLTESWIDGLELHPVTGRPVAFHVLRSHPGDFFFPGLNPLKTDRIARRFVVHWFDKFRPGQVRGVPTFTSALDLFNELRQFRKATLGRERNAASISAVLETDGPADVMDGDIEDQAFENLPIDMGMMATLPAGYKLHQYEMAGPPTTYEQFQEKCLGEACRPLGFPLNLALGTSQKFNFSSSKLDHTHYRNGLKVERRRCEAVVLEPLFRAWFEEAIRVPKLLPKGINSLADVPHEWHWPGFPSLDVAADTAADIDQINGGTQTWREFWAKRGYDWREMMQQQAEEKREIERLGLEFGAPLTKTATIEEDDPADTEAANAA